VVLGSGSIIFNAYRQTITRVVAGTFLNLAFTFPLAYVLAKRDLYGRNAITTYIFITMLFGGGLVPNFILVEKLGMLDSLWALIIPGLINPWWMLIMRNFIMGAIPYELQEAAIVDGASPLQILLRIILPLSKPIIATIGLWYAVSHWNAWFDALIYLFDPKKMPLQPILRGILMQGAGTYTEYGDFSRQAIEDALIEAPPAESLRSAMIIVSTVPILLVYPFIQKYFVKGVMVGGIKG
jgi:putative aldouronate transport system permease protein